MARFSKVFCVFFLVLACFGQVSAAGTRFVAYIIDGDTIIVDHREKVRLIGVDTPELHDEYRNMKNAARRGAGSGRLDEFATRAKAFVKGAVGGKPVRLEYDRESKDKYGRTLAYVFREPDNFFLNAELVKQGYGFAYTRFPFRYSDDFKRYEREAKINRKGIWA